MAATKSATKPAPGDGRTPVEYLQDALDDLTKARERASGDIRGGIDSAIERTREALSEAGSEAHGQIADWRSTLDKATEEVCRELGVLAVRAQRSPEGLRAMSAEIRKRRTEISPAK